MFTKMVNCTSKYKNSHILKKLLESSYFPKKKLRDHVFKEPINISINCLFRFKRLELDIYY